MREPVMDTSGEAHRGFMTGDDLANWRAEVEDPITIDYGDYTVCKAGPWAQSPVLLQQLALLKGFDIAGHGPLGPDFVHTVQECAKLAMADREAFYGDPKFVDVPLDRLLSEDYNAGRRKLVGAEARLDLPPGDIPGFGGKIRLQRAGLDQYRAQPDDRRRRVRRHRSRAGPSSARRTTATPAISTSSTAGAT